MCGIVGIFGASAGGRDREIAQMLASIRSRGEVDEVHITDRSSVGVRRLPIVDRERAVQPMATEDGSRFIIFNGEIFNHRALREPLAPHHTFTTASDTETILHAYEAYGERCVEHLDGQFAFVIHDVRTGSVFAARDPIGVVPLYFVRDGGTLHVASTIGALTFLYRPIHAVPPGHTLDLEGRLAPYVQTALEPADADDRDLTVRLKEALGSAVAKRVDTDLPVAVLYSGGIDSSVVLHEASLRHPDVTAFTIGASGSEDLAISRRFCAERGIRQAVVPITRKDVTLERVRRAIRATELSEYLDIINAIVSMPLFERIHAEGIKVALCGDGSDELFGGYPMHQRVAPEARDRLVQHKLMSLHRTELQRVDRCSLAYAVEARVPFLDPAVIRVAAGTARDARTDAGLEKAILREAYRDDLPPYIIGRSKNPLSHSSGVHEWARMYQIVFRRYYSQGRFDLHEPLRMDFSRVLADNGHDLDRAIAAERTARDYPRWELLKEAVKAGVRTYVPGVR